MEVGLDYGEDYGWDGRGVGDLVRFDRGEVGFEVEAAHYAGTHAIVEAGRSECRELLRRGTLGLP